MTKGQFLLMAFACAFETYFFNQALFAGDYLLAFFWAFLLLRDLQRIHNITKITSAIIEATQAKTKKKD